MCEIHGMALRWEMLKGVFFVAETCLIQYLSILGVLLINFICGSNMEKFSLSFIVLKNLERVRNEENKVIYLWLSSAIFLSAQKLCCLWPCCL